VTSPLTPVSGLADFKPAQVGQVERLVGAGKGGGTSALSRAIWARDVPSLVW
jgi:hypothetical protein